MRTNTSLLFAVLMAMAFSQTVAAEETSSVQAADAQMENLMDRITKLSAKAIPTNIVPVELASSANAAPVQQRGMDDNEKRGFSDGLQSIGEGFSNLGGNIKNTTVSFWHTITGEDDDAPNPSADLKFINKRGRNDALPAPVNPKSRNAPVPVIPASRNAALTKAGTASIPLTAVKLPSTIQARELDERSQLWDQIKKIASAQSKRELQDLQEIAKRSGMWDQMHGIAHSNVVERSELSNEKRSNIERSQLWDHIKKVASAGTKRELAQLQELAKRNGMWNELHGLATAGKRGVEVEERSTLAEESNVASESKRAMTGHMTEHAAKRANGKKPRSPASRVLNPKKRSLEGRQAVPQAYSLGSQNATFSGPGLSGISGNGTVTITFNSTELNLGLVNGSLVASAPLAVTTIQAAVDQLKVSLADEGHDDVQIVAAPVGLDTSINTAFVQATQDAHIASLEGLNLPTPTFQVKIPVGVTPPAGLAGRKIRRHAARGVMIKGQ